MGENCQKELKNRKKDSQKERSKQRKRRGRRENPPPFGPGETKDGRREKTLRSSSSSCKNEGKFKNKQYNIIQYLLN